MREKLIQYVQLLFAGAQGSEDIAQEILQNTLDRYDDLIAEGRTPEAAYRMAIMGIGDVNEILGKGPQVSPAAHGKRPVDRDTPVKKLLRAIAIALYILSPIPLILLSEFGLDVVGVCCLLAIVAVATALLIMGAKKENTETGTVENQASTPKKELQKSISNLIWIIGVVVYVLISFFTSAWYITWLLFPILGAIQGLMNAIFDLKEANSHEK